MKTNAEKIKQLRIARKAAGLSQHELASLVGLKEGTITFYETGRRNIPLGVLEMLILACKNQVAKNLKRIS